MPIQSCTKNGKSGYKYGDSGTCYTGPGARKKAAKQGAAIEISRHQNQSAFFAAISDRQELIEAIEDFDLADQAIILRSYDEFKTIN